MGIVMMIVAIALGQFIGDYLSGYLGNLAGGLAGVFIIGFITYVIYNFLTKSKFRLVNGLIFVVLIYIANMVAGYVATFIGIGGGVLTLVVAGFVASLLWGWIGGRGGSKKGRSLKL